MFNEARKKYDDENPSDDGKRFDEAVARADRDAARDSARAERNSLGNLQLRANKNDASPQVDREHDGPVEATMPGRARDSTEQRDLSSRALYLQGNTDPPTPPTSAKDRAESKWIQTRQATLAARQLSRDIKTIGAAVKYYRRMGIDSKCLFANANSH